MAYDLDAIVAESDSTPFVFTFGGEEFTWPAQLDLRAERELSEGKLWEALERMFGPDQYARFLATSQHLDMEVIKALFGAHAKHQGTTMGESRASAGSSKSTQRPSKQTSKPIIRSASPTSAVG